jgi:hypothetical protein
VQFVDPITTVVLIVPERSTQVDVVDVRVCRRHTLQGRVEAVNQLMQKLPSNRKIGVALRRERWLQPRTNE